MNPHSHSDAERTKKIQNKAIVNESPTDKLIRELKEENARLMKLLGQGDGDAGEDEPRARGTAAGASGLRGSAFFWRGMEEVDGQGWIFRGSE